MLNTGTIMQSDARQNRHICVTLLFFFFFFFSQVNTEINTKNYEWSVKGIRAKFKQTLHPSTEHAGRNTSEYRIVGDTFLYYCLFFFSLKIIFKHSYRTSFTTYNTNLYYWCKIYAGKIHVGWKYLIFFSFSRRTPLRKRFKCLFLFRPKFGAGGETQWI